ncbi:hypothetical protein PAL_GLEAN10007492 [Pteropus alecto]|uniref:Uncharacterized protein n=1 Tax=Pteropus alecto TaxID=9402 RepID=L5L2U5_PTEAL|nr:hypothetical protein PAL_GLEAN10007492 [Pteropus alecto]
MVPAPALLPPPPKLRIKERCRNYLSALYTDVCGILTAAAQGRAVYFRDIDRLPTLPRPQNSQRVKGPHRTVESATLAQEGDKLAAIQFSWLKRNSAFLSSQTVPSVLTFD